MRIRLCLAILAILAMASCASLAKKTPQYYVKPAPVYRTAGAQQAADVFWTAFLSADYASSDEALQLLMQAHQADPGDDHIAALSGLCSFWKVTEHGRAGIPANQLQGLAVHSAQMVTLASELNPHNQLTPGFIASAHYQLGAMQQNPALMNQAICQFQHNTEVYPQFHGFVQGWVLTAMLPPDHPCFDEAVEAYYKTLDSCAGIRIPRVFPKVGPVGLAILAKKSKEHTVCYDTNIAPHNLEGTLLGLGDAYVKQGKFRQARIVYESIPNIPSYRYWPYKDLLNQRLCNMEDLHDKFVADSGCLDVAEPAMLYQSVISCTGCHATNNPDIKYSINQPHVMPVCESCQ